MKNVVINELSLPRKMINDSNKRGNGTISSESKSTGRSGLVGFKTEIGKFA